MTAHAEKWIAEAVDAADEIQEPESSAMRAEKPRLLVEKSSPDRTVAALRDIFAAHGGLYDRGVPVRLVYDQMEQGTVVQVITPDGLVLMAHEKCRPYVLKPNKKDDTVDEVDAPPAAPIRHHVSRLAGAVAVTAAERHRDGAPVTGQRHHREHRRLRLRFWHVV